jgi:hypothetical protein
MNQDWIGAMVYRTPVQLMIFCQCDGKISEETREETDPGHAGMQTKPPDGINPPSDEHQSFKPYVAHQISFLHQSARERAPLESHEMLAQIRTDMNQRADRSNPRRFSPSIRSAPLFSVLQRKLNQLSVSFKMISGEFLRLLKSTSCLQD